MVTYMKRKSWDPLTKDKIAQIEKIQCRATLWTTSYYDSKSSVSSMLENLVRGWWNLKQRSDARLCLIYWIVYGLVAIPMPGYIHPKTCHPNIATQ